MLRWIALLLAAIGATAGAQDYPSKPVVIVVPAAAGGPTDTLTRVLAQAMGSAIKSQFIIENAGGAGGIIGINKAAKAKPDGYTLLLYHIGMATAPALYRKLPYDTLADFDYIGQVADVPMTLIAKKGTAAANFPEFLSYIKANRDQVPYKGTGPAMNDLVGGQVDFMCDQTTNTVPQIKSGNVKVYAVTTPSRLPSLPQVPTLDEQGVRGFDLAVWNGVYAPRGTPKAALDKQVGALQAAVQDPAFKSRLAELGAEPVPLSKATPESLRALLKSEVDKWSPIIRRSGVFAD